jgi:hypothetical protein
VLSAPTRPICLCASYSHPDGPSREKGYRTQEGAGARNKKRPKLDSVQAVKAAADFNCGAHLFQPIVPLPKDQSAITTILACLKKGTHFPKMPDSHGTFENICFHSSFPAPHNCCIMSICENYYASPPTMRLHINHSVDLLKSHHEAFWQPVVKFLKQDDLTSHFKPSLTLIALTPLTSWL